MNVFKRLLAFITFGLLALNPAYPQDCDPAELAKIPGTFKAGIPGSTSPLTKTELDKQREILTQIHKKVSGDFSPTGLEISYSNSLGFNPANGANWIANPYYYGMYFLKYVCGKSNRNDRHYQPEVSSNTQTFISINYLWSPNGPRSMYAADLPDDEKDRYFWVRSFPEKQSEGIYTWIILDENDRNQKEFIWLITKNDRLPFRPFTRREFIEHHLPKMELYLKELIDLRSQFDPNESENNKEFYNNFSRSINEQQKAIGNFKNLLTDLNPEELEMPAVIDSGQGNEEFRGFKKPGEKFTLQLVAYDRSYFDASLPKWAPQFICITFTHDTKNPVYISNVNRLAEVLDLGFFKSLLEKP